MFLSDEGPTLETLDFTIRIGSTRTFFIFRLVSEHCLRSTLRLLDTQLVHCCIKYTLLYIQTSFSFLIGQHAPVTSQCPAAVASFPS